MGEPIINIPYLVVKNVMFFVERMVTNPSELSDPLGSPYRPVAGTTFLPYMKDAVLAHVEPVAEEARRHIYRFYYMVPPKEQFRYNIQDMKKIQDGYTLKDTARTGVFMNQTTDPADLKDFYEIVREWVEPVDVAYEPLALGSFDPSNEKLDPDFYDLHDFTAYDAQLVYEEVGRFEQDYLNKIFRKVTRVYKTLPGPVVKEFIPYNIWVKGDTYWEHGGPGTNVPESDWVAQTAIKLSREVWGAPMWNGAGGAEPGQARVAEMPRSEFGDQPVSEGWDKASYPSLQNYVLVSMYKRNSGVVENEQQSSLSGNCCNPDSRFVRCINTTVTTSQSVDWTANGDLPAIDPPDPSENCSQWRVDSSVVVREGYSQKETRKSCTVYDEIEELWESQFDQITNQVYPVLRKIIKNPTEKFDEVWQAEGFAKYTDSVGNAYYARKLTTPVVKVPVTVNDLTWTSVPYNISDFTADQDGGSRPDYFVIEGVTDDVQVPGYPQFDGSFGVLAHFTQNNPGSPMGSVVAVKYKNLRFWNGYCQSYYPTEHNPGTMIAENYYQAPMPSGPWYTQNGMYRMNLEMYLRDTYYGEGIAGSSLSFPVGALEQSSIQMRGTDTNEVKFTTGVLPANMSVAFDIIGGNLYMNLWVANPSQSTIGGEIPLLMNGVEIARIELVVSDISGQIPTATTATADRKDYVAGDYTWNESILSSVNIRYDSSQFPYFQMSHYIGGLAGNVFKTTTNPDISRVVLRQWVNPCYAVDSYLQIPGIGYYRSYATTMNYSFPAIFGTVQWVAWNTRPDLSGRVGGKYFPQVRMLRDSYSGPCNAQVEELFSPDGSWPAGWGTGTSPQFVTNSGSFSTPLASFSVPNCLHTALTFSVSIGNQDSTWQSGLFTTSFPATSETTWKPVTSYYASPWNGGMLCKKVTVYPPTV